MARSATGEERRGGARSGGRRSGKRVEIGGALLLRLLEFEAEIRLLPAGQERQPKRGRGTRSIYDGKSPTPEGMSRRFPEDLAAMRRMGRPTNRCYTLDFGPYRLHCLPFYYYDGFHAMMYVEKDGQFVAAWSEWEVERPPHPHHVTVARSEDDLGAFLDRALPEARGAR